MTVGWLLTAILFITLGCEGDTVTTTTRTPPPSAPIPVVPPAPNPTADAIAKDQAAEAAAQKSHNELALLEAEKSEAIHQAQLAANASTQWQKVATQRDTDITTFKNDALKAKARWAAGILLAAALLGAVVAIWLPLVRSKAVGFSVACAAGATLCIAFIALVPYLVWIGAGIIGAFLIAMVVWWARSHGTLSELIAAIEHLTTKNPHLATDVKSTLSSVLSTKAVAHVQKVADSIDVDSDNVLMSIEAKVKADLEAQPVMPTRVGTIPTGPIPTTTAPTPPSPAAPAAPGPSAQAPGTTWPSS
jgi:ABC-type Fe3+-siderophore transport system permease subunit